MEGASTPAVPGASARQARDGLSRPTGSTTFFILILCLLFTVIGAVITALAVRQARSDVWRQSLTGTQRVAQSAQEQAARLIDVGGLILQDIEDFGRNHPIADQQSRSEGYRIFKQEAAHFPYIRYLSLFSPDGRLLASNLTDIPLDIDFSDRDFIRAHREGYEGLFVDRLLQGRVTDETNLVVSRAVRDQDGTLQAIVAISYSPGYLEKFYDELRGLVNQIALIRRDGAPLAFSPRLQADRILHLQLPPLPPDSSPIMRSFQAPLAVDGRDYLQTTRQVGNTALYVLAAVEISQINRTWWLRARIYLAVFAAVEILVLLLTGVAIQRARAEHRARRALAETNHLLEQRVDERTADLALVNQQLELRVRERDTLLRELNHRVKNNLQLICSLLSLQSGRLGDPAAREAFQRSLERVQSIATVHDLLHESSEAGEQLDFANFLLVLGERLSIAFSGMAEIKAIPETGFHPLGTETVIRLAIIVNEVVTNAVKHAFPDRTDGQVTIAFLRDGPFYRLTVADNGIGLPTQRSREGGLGSDLIEIFAAALQGQITWDSDAGGTRFELLFPDTA